MRNAPKRLRSLTIVPDSLYVQRDADRQLDRIVEEMGRPAYVLVARQMGKTNLLLHMKRSREAQGDVVCYFDLSTRHGSLQAFFRTIIDEVGAALSADETMERIRADRQRGMVPNVEYDLHLRMLVERHKPSRLVIVLDEIDSLIGISYSDRVLAQIRTMYFARENHAVYNSVTYVLSGVAEPSELIKDKNISPFNIGEKIYLENFSLSELSELLKKAGLAIPPAIVERVFYWTSGNPRMSWDICSSVEDIQRAGETLTIDSVDAAVARVYLRDFDRAPVDHIRTLVQADPGLRDALMTIHYGKADTLGDSVRSRLYLAGITKASGSVPEINNRIIAAALSTEWLGRLSDGQASQLDAARRHFAERDFGAAVRLYEQIVGEDAEAENVLDRLHRMQFGIALYQTHRFEEAARQLEIANTASGYAELRPSILFYLASAKLKAEEAEASLALFEEVAAQSGEFQLLAKLGLSGALLRSAARENGPRVIELSREIIARRGAMDDEIGTELTASAHYNVAQAYLAMGNRRFALQALEAALAVASPELEPALYVTLIEALDGKARKIEALGQVVDRLEQNLPIARRYGSTTLSFSNYTLGTLIAKALQLGDQHAADRLLALARKSLGEPSIGRVAVKILASVPAENDNSALLPLIEAGLARADSDQLEPNDIIALAKIAVISSDSNRKREAFDRYMRLVRTHEGAFTFETVDGLICIGQMTLEMGQARGDRTAEVIAFFDGLREPFRRVEPIIFTFYASQKMNYYQATAQDAGARLHAEEVLTLSNDLLKGEMVAPALQTFVTQLQTSARKALAVGPPDRFRRLGRNQMVRYRDTRSGVEKMAKFKKVETELRSGLFELVAPRLIDEQGEGQDR